LRLHYFDYYSIEATLPNSSITFRVKAMLYYAAGINDLEQLFLKGKRVSITFNLQMLAPA